MLNVLSVYLFWERSVLNVLSIYLFRERTVLNVLSMYLFWTRSGKSIPTAGTTALATTAPADTWI